MFWQRCMPGDLRLNAPWGLHDSCSDLWLHSSLILSLRRCRPRDRSHLICHPLTQARERCLQPSASSFLREAQGRIPSLLGVRPDHLVRISSPSAASSLHYTSTAPAHRHIDCSHIYLRGVGLDQCDGGTAPHHLHQLRLPAIDFGRPSHQCYFIILSSFLITYSKVSLKGHFARTF